MMKAKQTVLAQTIRINRHSNPAIDVTISRVKQEIKTPATFHQHNSSGPKLQMRPSEVTDIDQPLYDWGIENRMDQYYNTAPPQAHFAAMEEPVHQVPNYHKSNVRQLDNSPSNYPVSINGHCNQSSIQTNSVYASSEPMPNTHENQVDTSATICTNKETISPPRLSSIKQNLIPIKQEQESLYEPEFIPNFSNNNGSRLLHHETQLPQHCQPRFEQTSQTSLPQHNLIHYGNYDSSHQQNNIVTNGPMSQQTNFTDGITSGDMSNHIIRGNKGTGNNIQAVDMDVNEILKVERKRARNRVAATKCRLRKLERISVLDTEASKLRAENESLNRSMEKLKIEISELKQELRWHVNNGCKAWRSSEKGKTSLIDKIMAEDNSNHSNTYIGILHHEITKSSTGGSANEQQPSNGESYQYFDQKSRNRGHSIIQNELQNNNQGFPPNRLPSSSDSSLIDERKQKVVASPDSTTAISGDRNSQMSGRGSLNSARNKNKSNL